MAKNQEMPTTKNHSKREITGGCHCRAIRFKATVPFNSVILRCNCSICAMTGFTHLIVKHENFEQLSGQKELTDYQFNSRKAHHLFCRICGIKSFYQPRSHPDCWSISSQCIDDFNPSEWTFENFDGQNWETAHINLSDQTQSQVTSHSMEDHND